MGFDPSTVIGHLYSVIAEALARRPTSPTLPVDDDYHNRTSHLMPLFAFLP